MSSEEEVVETDKTEESPMPDLAALLSAFPGAPDSAKLEEWKQEHGEIFCSGFSDKELFIFKALSWRTHKALQKLLATPPVQGQEPMSEFDYQQKVVENCLLWKTVSDLGNKGGTIPTLYEQIMMNSNFMDPRMAAAFVIKL